MSFRPNAHDTLTIDGITYEIAEHPAAPGLPHGQEGRAGTVYHLLPSPAPEGDGGKAAGGWGEGGVALKVFKPRFRLPYLVSQAQKIAAFAELPGLSACRRTVLTPSRHADLLRQYPDLTYAILMPWIEGPTWQEVVLERKPLTPQQSLELARAFAEVLLRMEEQGIAHCDLSGPNVMLPALADGGPPTIDRPPSTVHGQPSTSTVHRPPSTVELIDLEGLYAPGLTQPNALSSGSMGYAHHAAEGGLWQPEADRFAGAVILAEMLAWCDPQVVEAAWGESYFDPAEMQQEGERFRLMSESLRRTWGDSLAALFQRAWASDALADCPTFGEWLVALPERPPVGQAFSLSLSTPGPAAEAAPPAPFSQEPPAAEEGVKAEIRALMRIAQHLEEQQNLSGAREAYREALSLAQQSQNAALARELEVILNELAKKEPAPAASAPISPAPARRGEPPEDSLEALFDQAQNAMQRQEWAKAHTLLNTIYQRQPNYQRGGQKAWVLLQKADRHMRNAVEIWDEIQRFTLKKGWLDNLTIVWALAFNSDGKTVYAGCGDGTVWELDLNQGEILQWENNLPGIIYGVACSQDGVLATGMDDGTVQLWQSDEGEVLCDLKKHDDAVESVAFSPDGNILASASDDKTICLWRVGDGALLKTLEHEDSVIDVAFSPDNLFLIAALDNGSICLWQSNDGKLLKKWQGHSTGVSSVDFSPTGQIFASGSDDNTVRLWRVSDGALLRTLEGHTDWVNSVAFSPDGALLASASDDGTVRLWRVCDGVLMHTLVVGHRYGVNSVAFSPDGALLASGSNDGIVRLWGVK